MTQPSFWQKALIRTSCKPYKPWLALPLLTLLTACSGSVPDNLGVRDGRLAPCPSSPNCVSSQASGEHYIEPLALKGSAERTQQLLKQVLASEPRMSLVQEQEGYLRAEYTSRLMRFVDDLEFVIGAQAVDLRSASRLGYSDLGANRTRIEHLRQQLAAQPSE